MAREEREPLDIIGRTMVRIGFVVVRARYLVVALWLTIAGVCLLAFPSISSAVQSDNSIFLPGTTPSRHAAQLTSPFQPPRGDTAVIVAARTRSPLTPADQTAVSKIETAVARVPHVTQVDDQAGSRDGRARKALIAIDIGPSGSSAGTVVDTIRHTLTGPSGLLLHLTGHFATNVDSQRASADAGRKTQLLSNLVILVMLLVVYRALLAPLITLAPAFLTLLTAGPIIAKASEAGLQVSSVTQIILTVLILGAGTDYGLFLVLRMREELRAGYEPHDAVLLAMARVGESISFFSGTVIVALLSLLLATFGIYHWLGPSLAIGIALMLLAALTLLPALLSIFGRAVFWPARLGAGPGQTGIWGRIAGEIVERPVLTLCAGVVLFGVLIVLRFGYAPAGFAGSATGPTGSDSALGTAALEAHYPASAVNPTTVALQFRASVWKDLSAVQKAEQLLAKAGVFRSISGPLDPNGTYIQPAQLASLYHELGPPGPLPPVPAKKKVPVSTYNAYRATGQLISPDGRTVQFHTTLAAGDPSSPQAFQAVPSIRHTVAGVTKSVGARDGGVAGLAAVSYDVSNTSSNDLRHIVPIVLLLIAIVLAIVMRSLVAPLYLIASVALSYVASLGLAVLIFMRIAHEAGLDFVLPFLMLVFLMALDEDYNILVMSRIREEAAKGSLKTAVTRTLNATGTTVTSAGLILAATFGVSAVAGSTDQIRQLGTGIALGVLLDTFLVRTLLVPSTVILLGRWNWWPSRLGRGSEVDTLIEPRPIA